jgi:putative transposase
LTAASTGTPSQGEGSRPDPNVIANFAPFVITMTQLLNEQEAFEPQNTTLIHTPVYTADLTTSQLNGMQPSIGTIGDAYDNALAETTIGL